MSDFYQSIVDNTVGRRFLKQVGLPTPLNLPRYQSHQVNFFTGKVFIGCGDSGSAIRSVLDNLACTNAEIYYSAAAATATKILKETEARSLKATGLETSEIAKQTFDALIFDASGFTTVTELNQLYYFFNPIIRRLNKHGRVIIIGHRPEGAESAQQAAAMTALEGFNRSLAKETGKKGCTSQILFIEENSPIDAPLRFLLSCKSAYITGQSLFTNSGSLEPTEQHPTIDWQQPLKNKIALVTGAAQGIGAAIARVLARDGAHVLGIDIPPAEQQLTTLCTEIDGTALVVDITADDATKKILEQVEALGGLDVLVHNAGITRDKTLANMSSDWWSKTIDLNLLAIDEINQSLLVNHQLKNNGRIICISSISGIAGQAGQTNYAASKAGVIGYVEHMASRLSDRNITINAVAPGFIETRMTRAIPMVIREMGRRLNSLSQGGQPVDVAEAVAMFANPMSGNLSGNTLRVCGQSLLGA